MLTGEPFRYILLIALILLNVVDFYIHIPVTFQVAVHTIFLVYIGSVFSTKAYEVSKERDIETMKQKDAWMFPVIGSAVLFGLFLLFKVFDKDNINVLFHYYFSAIAVFSVSNLIYERLSNISFFEELTKTTLFKIPSIKYIIEKEIRVDLLDLVTLIPGVLAGLAYFVEKNWFTNNILGITFSIFGIENIMLGQYKVGFILLSLLFGYDIFWVFGTPVMVAVAKNLDGPIKLMFPKVLDPIEPKDYNMIGLGDIVIPGIYIALMLRYDIIKYAKSNKLPSTPFSLSNCKYFLFTIFGYSVGIVSTLFIMITFQAAQPALLYLVPGCLIFSLLPAFVNGDLADLWNFNEEVIVSELKEKEKAKTQ